MRLSDFDYDLPESLIAQEPVEPRDHARLMIVERATGRIRHDRFDRIGDHLPAGGALIFNDTRVRPVRLLGRKERSGGRVEVLLLERRRDGRTFRTLMRPLSKIRAGDRIIFGGDGLRCEVLDVPRRLVRFDGRDVYRRIEAVGHVPLPPYIRRPDRPGDRERYQTVYARHPGSAAAPTAGLHFTPALLDGLRRAGHRTFMVTLHVNDATFKPVETEDVRAHRMHTERYSVGPGTWERIRAARAAGRRLVAVGTTSCRVLETLARGRPLRGRTDIFLRPGVRFEMTDALITNFHLPRSTLLMLVHAFGSPGLMRRAYREAVRRGYRFYSYGDAMLIL